MKNGNDFLASDPKYSTRIIKNIMKGTTENMHMLGGVLIGLALGTAAALLAAPASGEKTRRKLDKQFRKFRKDTDKRLQHKLDDLKKMLPELKT